MLWSILEKIIPSVTADEEPLQYENEEEYRDSKQSVSKGNQEYDESESDQEEEPVKKTSNVFRPPEREKPQLDFNMLKRQDSVSTITRQKQNSSEFTSSNGRSNEYYETFVYEKKEIISAENTFQYKKQQKQQPVNFKVRRSSIAEKRGTNLDMSMRADADRLSQALGDHERFDAAREELKAAEDAEQARLEVLQKGKKLALQQMNRGLRKEQHKSKFGAGGAGRVEKAVERQINSLRDSDRSSSSFLTQVSLDTTRSSAGVSITKSQWKKLLEQEEPLSRSQLQRVRYESVSGGIPEKYRGQIWCKLFNVDNVSASHASCVYAKLLEMPNVEAETLVPRDINRTMPHFNLWTEDWKSGNNKLFNVLKAYANYDTEVGYVQGLNYIVALLLFYIPDEESVFWCLIGLMNERNRNWRSIYIDGFPKVKSMSKILERKIRHNFPECLRHLIQNDCEIEGTFSPFFMTLYVYKTPIEIATRLFEIFILDGETALIKILLRVIELRKRKILRLDDMDLHKYMKEEIIEECIKKYTISALIS